MSGLYKKRDSGSLKEAEAQLVNACGGLKVAASVSRIGKSVIAAATDSDHPERHLPVDVVVDLERRAGQPIVTRYLASESGHLLLPVRGEMSEPYPIVISRITKEVGELLTAGAFALREGKMNAAGARNIKREALDLAAAIAELIADCDAETARGAA